MVFSIFYTGINVPYASLNGLMTTNQYERGLLGNFRMLLATAGTMTVNTVVLKMVTGLGNGNQYDPAGWTKTYVILSLITIGLNFFTFFFCKERVVENTTQDGSTQKISFGKSVKGLFKNKYWVLMVIVLFSMYFMMSCFFGSAAYFAQYNMNDMNTYAPISNALSLAQIVTMFVTPFLMKKVSKRYTMLFGMGVSVVGFVGTALVGSNLTAQVVCSVIKGIGFGCGAATMFGLLQDAITYGQWLNGFGTTGMGNAASSFCTRVGSGIGTAALGWILSAGGFEASAKVQSAQALSAINVAFTVVPVILVIVVVVCMIFFDLDKFYAKIIDDLENGRHKGDSSAAQTLKN